MKKNKTKYISKYNKENYKMYQFRVRKDNKILVDFLDSIDNRNYFINKIVQNYVLNDVLTIKQIKKAVMPLFYKYGVTRIRIFGSYARGEATSESDIDFYIDRGNIKTFADVQRLEDELVNALGKKVDIIFDTSKVHPYIKKQMMEDMIELCQTEEK